MSHRTVRRQPADFDASAPRGATARGVKPDPADFDLLLAEGPFSEALRAAIRLRGLSLERIQAKLAALGTPVSLATLSHWQSGRSQPERSASLLALGHLERMLGLRPQALAVLLEPPRRRGRQARAGVDLVEIYHDKSAVIAALREFDSVWGNAMTGLSQHDRVLVGADGFMRSQWNRRVMRATMDGPDRLLAVYSVDGVSTPTVTPVRGCSLGRVVTDHQAGLIVAELLFGHSLRQGEFLVIEHRIDLTKPCKPDMQSVRRLPQPLREHVVEVEFAASRKPARCLQLASPAVDSEDFTERLLSLDEFGRACAVALDVGPCQFGIRWEWPSEEGDGWAQEPGAMQSGVVPA